MERAKTPDEVRMAQTVLIPNLLGVTDVVVAQIIGCSRATVVRLRKRFRALCSGGEVKERNWGGRRCGYMALEEESQFLSKFLEQAASGGVLDIGKIKLAFEAQVGRRVARTTICRMLERHGWRKISPRPRHPKSDAQAQEGFKKNSAIWRIDASRRLLR